MVYPELEEKLQHSRCALKGATSENIIELCKQYLALLADYRSQLYKLQGTSGIHQQSLSFSSREDVSETRKVVRAAIENTTQERNRTELLLLSFTTVSGYEAVVVFNRLKYMGHVDWELRASGVKFSDGTDRDLLTIQEAVDIAGLLRREEHVAAQAFKQESKPVTP
ncbi:MAG TPA: hypothetical protein VIG25_18790 [Pyrinomonadaceae bacterium]|jgi:hypothetical protein